MKLTRSQEILMYAMTEVARTENREPIIYQNVGAYLYGKGEAHRGQMNDTFHGKVNAGTVKALVAKGILEEHKENGHWLRSYTIKH